MASQRVETVAMAIYGAAFDAPDRTKPSPGWCWERAGEAQREFCRRQARAAILADQPWGAPR